MCLSVLLVQHVLFVLASFLYQDVASITNAEQTFINVCPNFNNSRENKSKIYNYVSMGFKTFRIQQVPLGCGSNDKEFFLLRCASEPHKTFDYKSRKFTTSEGAFVDTSPRILSDGTFFDGKYYFRNDGQYCVQTITSLQIEVQVCRLRNIDISIPKCCRIDESLNNFGECVKLDRSNSNNNWRPKIYHSAERYTSPITYSYKRLKFYSVDLSNQCKSATKIQEDNLNLSNPLFMAIPAFAMNIEHIKLVLYSEQNKTSLKPLTFQYNKRKWKLDTDANFCVDTINSIMKPEGASDYFSDFMIIMCYSDVISNTRPYNHSDKRLKAYIKAIVTLISAVFLLALVVLYLVSWTKNNLHARIVLMYSLSMLGRYTFLSTAQFIFLFPRPEFTGIGERGIFCMTIAIGAHYFYLGSYVWMTVLNFDIVNTFRKLKTSYSSNRSTVLLKYCVVGWGLPTIFIACLVVMDTIYRDPLSEVPVPNYGTTSCFVNLNFRGQFVYLPMGILLVFNIPLMIWTQNIFCMARNRQANELQGGTSQKFNAECYTYKLLLKLFVVMGGSYLVQFLTWYYYSTREKQETPWIVQIFEICSNLSPVCLFFIFCVKITCSDSLVKCRLHE